ncbi:MAG: transporter substrate-binding domain-containing protein [Thermodesulfobacteriota bacterium]
MRHLLLAVVFFLALAGRSDAEPSLRLNTFAGPPLSTPDQSGYYDRILSAAFQRLGLHVTIGHLPAERSLLNANAGIDDGDFVRIAGLEQRYPNLVMVPEPLDEFHFVVFTRHLALGSVEWSSLTPYAVGIVRGWKILEENLAGVRELTRVKNQEQLFKLLKNGRIDAAVYARKEGWGLVHRLGISDAVALSPPLAVRPMHLYLHRRHAGLAPRLAAVFRSMKQDGSYGAIARQTLPEEVRKEARDALP